jgi:hypothetical protein
MWVDMKNAIGYKNAIVDYSKHLTVEKCRSFITNLNLFKQKQ